MDFAKALTYPFDDPEWASKLGIAAAVSAAGVLLGILIIPAIAAAILLLGWQYEIMKNVKNGVANPMVAWDDFGGLFKRGGTMFLALLVYQIPVVIFACAAAGVFVLPLLGGSEDAMAALGGVATIIAICCSCLIFIYAIFAYMVYMAGMVRFIDAPEFSTFMAFGDNISLFRDNMGDFGMAILFLVGAGLLVGVATSILSFVLIGFLVAFVQQAFLAYFSGHVLGQLAIKLNTAPAV